MIEFLFVVLFSIFNKEEKQPKTAYYEYINYGHMRQIVYADYSRGKYSLTPYNYTLTAYVSSGTYSTIHYYLDLKK